MKIQIFALYDKKALAYLAPSFWPHVGQAIRGLEDLMAQDSQISRHPADFDLYRLGSFDDETGALTPCMTDGDEKTPAAILPPQFVQSAISFQKIKPISTKNQPIEVLTNGKGE